MKIIAIPCVVVVMLFLTGCGSTEGRKVTYSRDRLTAAEISTISAINAYEAFQQLRPMFLVSRGPKSLVDRNAHLPLVYMNEMKYGELATLRQIGVEAIEEMQYISARDATTRFGTGHVGGVIMVLTKKR